MIQLVNRRRFRFSIRVLLLFVLIVGAGIGWWLRQLDWIRQRRDFLNHPPTHYLHVAGPATKAPWSLRLFGERGYSYVSISFGPWTEWQTHQLTDDESRQLNHIKRLFPEALVSTAPLDGRSPYMKAGKLPLPLEQ